MKKTFLILIVLLSLYGVASAAGPGQLTYTPLEPFNSSDKTGAYDNFAYYVNTVFKLLITLGALFAVVMLVVAGIGYMVSEAAVDIEKAKQRARAALWGLLLLTGCWLILNTINPDLLKFNLNIPGSTSSSPTTGAQTQVTINPNSVKIYNGPDAYENLLNQQDKCRGTLRSTDGGIENGKEYTIWSCQ